MIVLLVASMALLGGTTWFGLQQSDAGNPVLNRRLTGAGLALCLLVVVSAVLAAVTLGVR
jgi:hypothetical protein